MGSGSRDCGGLLSLKGVVEGVLRRSVFSVVVVVEEAEEGWFQGSWIGKDSGMDLHCDRNAVVDGSTLVLK